jgi:hypothetical protein
VTFYSCLSAASCASTTSLGTATIRAGGQATFSTPSLPVGTTYVEAVYPGASTNFSGSTSNVITQVVTTSGVSTKPGTTAQIGLRWPDHPRKRCRDQGELDSPKNQFARSERHLFDAIFSQPVASVGDVR